MVGDAGIVVSGKSLFGTLTFPSSSTVYSFPLIVTLDPFGYLSPVGVVTLYVTSPVFPSWPSFVTVGTELSTNFAGICLSSLVSAGSFVPSFTVTFPVWIVSFSWLFLIVIVPSFTLNVPSIPGTVTTESSG